MSEPLAFIDWIEQTLPLHEPPDVFSSGRKHTLNVLYIISFETNETVGHGGIGKIFLFSIFFFQRKFASVEK